MAFIIAFGPATAISIVPSTIEAYITATAFASVVAASSTCLKAPHSCVTSKSYRSASGAATPVRIRTMAIITRILQVVQRFAFTASSSVGAPPVKRNL